jgi:2'-5' RNA ligase
MTAHFNIALYPQSTKLAESLIELAAKNLSGQTDKYLLGKRALPHISLGHFACQAEAVKDVWSACEDLVPEPLSIQFSHIYIRAGVGLLHQGRNWVGLSVVPTILLSHLQKSVYGRLEKIGIDSPTKPDIYFPHLTFGRLAKACAVTITRMPDNDFWQGVYPFAMSLGRSDDDIYNYAKLCIM